MKTRKKYISSRFSVEIQKKSSASRMNAPKGGEQKKNAAQQRALDRGVVVVYIQLTIRF